MDSLVVTGDNLWIIRTGKDCKFSTLSLVNIVYEFYMVTQG